MKKLIIFILFALLLSNCAINAKSKKNKIPKWLKNPKAVYPDQLYLTAIGEGDTRQDAQNMAVANLSKIFESKIKSEENVNQRYMELTKNNKTQSTDYTSVNKNVQITSNQKLFNIQFAQSYIDENGIVHVLAYINREQTSEIYQEKIENNSKKVVYLIKKAKKENNPIKKYAYLSAAMIFAKKNKILIEQLEIIDHNALDLLKLGYTFNDLSIMLSDAARNVDFTIALQGDSYQVASILEGILTDMGFILGRNGVLKVEGKITFEPTSLNRRDGFKFMRYTLNLKLKDNLGNIIVALNEKGREGHISLKEAKERCIRKIEKKLKKSFKNKLIKYFDNLAME